MDEKQASNSIIEYLKACDPELMDRVVKVFAECRKLDFLSIRQGDIMVVTPEKAFEYKGNEGDKYFKIWMAGDKIAWCTWANSMIDSRFRWNSKDADPRSGGIMPIFSGMSHTFLSLSRVGRQRRSVRWCICSRLRLFPVCGLRPRRRSGRAERRLRLLRRRRSRYRKEPRNKKWRNLLTICRDCPRKLQGTWILIGHVMMIWSIFRII